MPRNHATFLAAAFFLNLLLVDPSAADQWDNQFGLRGLWGGGPAPSQIKALCVSGTDLYAVGNMYSHDMLRWDGVAWSAVGAVTFSPITSALYAIVEHQGSIVVGGDFEAVNGQTGELAFWDGTTWTAVHSSLLENGVGVLASDGTNLYMSGASLVVRYNGTTFEPLATSVTSHCCAGPGVSDLLCWNDRLYVVGHFTSVDGVTLNKVGYWDGAQWNAMGAGANDLFPDRVFVHNDEIYICGGSRFAIDIRKWTGTQWVDAVTDNVTCEFGGGTLDAMFFHGQLYQSSVGGTTNPGGTPVSGVAKWTGSAWDDMDGGVEGGYPCSSDGPGPLVEYDGHLVVVGGNTAGGMPSPGFAFWDGDRWYANAPDDRVRVIATSGSDVYLGGEFEMALDTPINHVAKWDGSSWNALGSGVDGTVHDMVMIGSDLYVAGDFTDAGGTGAKNVAKWDGANWSAIGATPPLYGVVRALATDGVNLYAGGDFIIVGSSVALRVAKWDGTSWSALGGGITNGSVEALLWYDGDLYAGGSFTQTENLYLGNVVSWDGSAWTSLNGGFGELVRDFEVHSGVLYAGGDFTHSFTGIVNHIAAWNGVTWDALDTFVPKGVNAPVHAMASVGGVLYVAGDFTTAGGETASHIAGWDGEWHALGSGLNRPAEALAVGAGALFVGGEFSKAGGFGSRYFARWTLTPTAVTTSPTTATALGPAYPNPFNPATHIRYRVADAGRVTIAVYDVHGRRVRMLLNEAQPGSPNEQSVTWDGSTDDRSRAASGVYFVRMTAPAFDQTRKMVLLK